MKTYLRIFATLAAAAVAACSDADFETAASAHESNAHWRRGACERASWVAGTTEWCEGRLIYRDYVYDDYGADTGVPSFSPFAAGTLAATAGDQRYPEGAENTADLVRLELSETGTRLRVEFELNALFHADQTIAVVAIDSDDNPATGGGDWPGLQVASRGWDVIYRFGAGDPETNIITGEFPRPSGKSWRIWAITAQADGTIMNVAFRGPDEKVELLGAVGVVPSDTGAWWEDLQAAALRNRDITAFSARVESRDFSKGTTRAAEVGPGLHQRVYASAYTLGEGVSYSGVGSRINESNSTGSQQFHILGKYQPYGYYIPPKSGDTQKGRRPGLHVHLHGLGSTHAIIVNQPGFQRAFGDSQNDIIVSPLGRGVSGFYSDISERDVLDVVADATANLDVDPDRIVLSGYSAGGYGALRLGALYPDRFAAVVNWVGPTGDDLNTPAPGNPTAVNASGQLDSGAFLGNMVDYVGNLRHLPSVHAYVGTDELVTANNALTLRDRLKASSSLVHEFYLYPAGEHLTFALIDDWRHEAKFVSARKRAVDPSRVTFRTDEAFRYAEYDIKHDGAYWVSDIRARGEGPAAVDVESRGCGHPDAQLHFREDLGFDPIPWVRQERRQVNAVPVARERALTANLQNVASVNIDDKRACLKGKLTYRILTDGPVSLRFRDGRTLNLPAGEHVGSI